MDCIFRYDILNDDIICTSTHITLTSSIPTSGNISPAALLIRTRPLHPLSFTLHYYSHSTSTH